MNRFFVWLFLFVGGMCSGGIMASDFELAEPHHTLIGELTRVRARHEDTLLDIGRRHGLGVEEISLANPELDRWLPGADAVVLIPGQFLLPQAPRSGIVLNVPEMRLYYFPPDQPNVVSSYPLGVGRQGWRTPYIRTRIIGKKAFPNWYPPESIREEHEAAGDPLPRVVKAGPDNPLGDYALRLGQPDYLIHGTNRPWGVGMRVSHGCIRLYPEDIESLFAKVELNTPVNIINQPYKVGVHEGVIYLEAHTWLQEDDHRFRNNVAVVLEQLEAVSGNREYELDWSLVEEMISRPNGYPGVVGFLLP